MNNLNKIEQNYDTSMSFVLSCTMSLSNCKQNLDRCFRNIEERSCTHIRPNHQIEHYLYPFGELKCFIMFYHSSFPASHYVKILQISLSKSCIVLLESCFILYTHLFTRTFFLFVFYSLPRFLIFLAIAARQIKSFTVSCYFPIAPVVTKF